MLLTSASDPVVSSWHDRALPGGRLYRMFPTLRCPPPLRLASMLWEAVGPALLILLRVFSPFLITGLGLWFDKMDISRVVDFLLRWSVDVVRRIFVVIANEDALPRSLRHFVIVPLPMDKQF